MLSKRHNPGKGIPRAGAMLQSVAACLSFYGQAVGEMIHGEHLDLGSVLPGVRWQACLQARVFEKGVPVPTKLGSHLRQQKAMATQVTDEIPWAPTWISFGSAIFRRRESTDTSMCR